MLGRYFRNLALHGRIDPVEYYVCDAFRVVYVENAKVACTAIKQVLFPGIAHDAHGQDGFHEALRPLALTRPPGGAAADYLHFSFFRDPAARLASCHADKIARAAAASDASIFHSHAQRAIFVLFAGIDPAAPGLTLADFALAACRLPDCLRDRHIMSQAAIHASVTAAPRHFCGTYERLAQDWATLQRLTGLPALPALNRSAAAERHDPDWPAPVARQIARAYRRDLALPGMAA